MHPLTLGELNRCTSTPLQYGLLNILVGARSSFCTSVPLQCGLLSILVGARSSFCTSVPLQCGLLNILVGARKQSRLVSCGPVRVRDFHAL